jgi:cell division protease FtsH
MMDDQNEQTGDLKQQQTPQSQPPNLGPGRKISVPGCNIWGLLAWLLIGGVVIPWLYSLWSGDLNRVQISYSMFRQQLQADNIERVIVTGTQIEGELRKPVPLTMVSEDKDEETSALTRFFGQGSAENEGEKTETFTKFITYLPSFGDEGLLTLLETHNVEIDSRPDTQFSWITLISNFLPWFLILGVAYMFLRQMRARGQNIFSIGQSRARLYDRRKEGTTFEDVAGAQGAKAELQEIIEFLKNPDRFQRLGGEMPKGVLLVGPPGTGKTLMARAVAGEADVPFFSITGSDFMEMFVGVGASRVRDLFDDAKKASPSIIFIDELDSIGRRRGAGLGGAHDEREQTLNQLLSELDGFEPNEDVIVMAATNRPDILDPALLRPGRFDRRITVDLPTMKDRLEILKIHARDKPLADDVDLERLARGTPGFSGADLENLLNEAALLAARRDVDAISRRDIEEARDKIMMGLARENLALTDEECKLLAYHEAGHAVVAAVLPNADPIHKVTIVPRGRAMGVTQQLPEKDKYIFPKSYMMDRLAVMMGGRAAENLVFDAATSGAANDLKQATRLARKMVLDWGMSERLSHIALGGRREQVFLGEEIAQRREYSEATAREVDQEIQAILKDVYDRAFSTLQEYRSELDKVANALLENEEIPGEEVLRLVGVSDDTPL